LLAGTEAAFSKTKLQISAETVKDLIEIKTRQLASGTVPGWRVEPGQGRPRRYD
jgi:hypothetical protein